MAPKRALQNILGHKKWGAILYISPPPTFKSGGLSPPISACSAAPVVYWRHCRVADQQPFRCGTSYR